MVERIKQIMEYYKLTPASFAEQIGINRSNLTHLFSGRNQPSLDLAKKILHYYPDIKTEWLIMGVGNMFRNNKEKELQIQSQNEKKQYVEESEADLFSNVPSTANNTTHGESHTAEKNKNDVQIYDSRETEDESVPTVIKPIENESLLPHPPIQVTKIVFFYSDNSFEVFHPNKK
jgi:transcriptional regulator with XRE-family HTH domain